MNGDVIFAGPVPFLVVLRFCFFLLLFLLFLFFPPFLVVLGAGTFFVIKELLKFVRLFFGIFVTGYFIAGIEATSSGFTVEMEVDTTDDPVEIKLFGLVDVVLLETAVKVLGIDPRIGTLGI